jgi:pilus assembly protein CpaB
MKRARLMVVLVAILAAAAAGFMAWGMMRPAPQVKQVVKKEMETVKVLVAKGPIGFGDAVRSSDFTWQAWPKDAPLDGYITQLSRPNAANEFAGAIARTSFLAGEPVKPAKLAKPGEGGIMAAILPAGYRAVATKIAEETAAGNFILPGDSVDVIVTRKQRSANGRGDSQVSETLFRNIRVLAIGQELDQKDGKKALAGKTATLQLTSGQAETLALNNSIGEISLSLRSLEDSSKSKGATPDEDAPKKESSGIKVLRYGSWSRTFGLQ